MFVMVGCMRDELLAMRSGLTDIIPPELLEGLTAEVRLRAKMAGKFQHV